MMLLVFAGASVSASVFLSIKAISESQHASFDGLKAFYSLVMAYGGGKIVSYYSLIWCRAESLRPVEEPISGPGKCLSLIRQSLLQPCLQPYYYHVAAETTGFALKTFLIDTLFGLYYLNLGLGNIALIGLFVLFIICVVIALAEVVQWYLFQDPYINEYLLDYDSDAFALCIASMILIIFYKTLTIAPRGSFHFSWQEVELPLTDEVVFQIFLEVVAAGLMFTVVALAQMLLEIVKTRNTSVKKKREAAAIIDDIKLSSTEAVPPSTHRVNGASSLDPTVRASSDIKDDLADMVDELDDDDDDAGVPVTSRDTSSTPIGEIEIKQRLSQTLTRQLSQKLLNRGMKVFK